MAVTNTDEKDDKSTTVETDDKKVTEDDLRDLKYGSEEVETSKEADETTESEESEEEPEEAGGEEDKPAEDAEEEEETPPAFVKQFPNIKGDTPEEYAKNLEEAYNNSTAEALRLKGLTEQPKTDEKSTDTEVDITNPLELYAKQQMDKEITTAYADFSKQYSQVNDPTEYNKFTTTVAQLSNTILQSEKRLASPGELYAKSAVILGWQPEDIPTKADKVAAAAKDGAAASKTSSATKTASKSKVTDAMVSVNRKMYPDKSDAEIRKELEEYAT